MSPPPTSKFLTSYYHFNTTDTSPNVLTLPYSYRLSNVSVVSSVRYYCPGFPPSITSGSHEITDRLLKVTLNINKQ